MCTSPDTFRRHSKTRCFQQAFQFTYKAPLFLRLRFGFSRFLLTTVTVRVYRLYLYLLTSCFSSRCDCLIRRGNRRMATIPAVASSRFWDVFLFDLTNKPFFCYHFGGRCKIALFIDLMNLTS